ncbi:MAG TPA: signal peptide peptidase SppA [archaeon]|nr:signal peptide peptidase SppA [archaeon]
MKGKSADENKSNRQLLIAFVAIGTLALIALVFVLLFSALPAFGGNEIAVIPLKGEITNQKDFFSDSLTADEIVGLIDKADKDPSVGAILIDIDSPGGEVFASKQIVFKLREAKKPTFSYIESVGASGAYYVAAATDYIMADEDSLTGSIGAVWVLNDFQKLFDNLGIKVTILKDGKFKAIGSPFKELTDEEEQMLQSIISQTAQGFKQDVLEFREGKLSAAEFNAVADGRILTGKQALEKNLVDELLHTKEKSFERVAEIAGIKDHAVVYFGSGEKSFFSIFFESGKAFGAGFVSSLTGYNVSAADPLDNGAEFR